MKPSSTSSGDEVFDARGDLKLIVGADKVAFKVCSRALARSSPVWEALLYGPFAEGKAQQHGGDWEIPLPEDRPEALRILIAAVHRGADDLPRQIGHEQLLRLTVIADKYDMTGSLKPLWDKWVRNLGRVADRKGQKLVDYLLICYKLGHGAGFRGAFFDLVSRAATDNDGRLHVDGFREYELYADDHPWLLDILGKASVEWNHLMKWALLTPTQRL